MLLDAIRSGFDLPKLIMCALSAFVVIFITMPIHEWAHGFVSTKLGDPTPRYQGRLTLNPMAHIDLIGALGILLFGIGWAKPVQVNARYYKNQKLGMAIVAAAGPISNMFVAFISMLLSNLALYINSAVLGLSISSTYSVPLLVAIFFQYVALINISLAVFNLIPIPPFDGSRILFVLLPSKYYFKIMQYERFIFMGLLLVIYLGVFDMPLQIARGAVFNFIDTLASLPFRLLIG